MTDRYHTIVADPPWDVKAGPPSGDYKVVDGKQVWNLASTRTRDLAYPPMTLPEIMDIPVGDLAEPDAHLYLWTTNGYLPHAFDVIRAWGFTYSTTIVWAKTPFGGGGLGGAWRITSEYLLFARRGRLPTKDTIIGTWFHEKRPYEGGYPKHSAKPDSFQDRIEQVSPGPYLELFARRNRLGWHTWGDEALNHCGDRMTIDPVCAFHGKRHSEHDCLYCCLCFTDLTPDTSWADAGGQKWDVCRDCGTNEPMRR